MASNSGTSFMTFLSTNELKLIVVGMAYQRDGKA